MSNALTPWLRDYILSHSRPDDEKQMSFRRIQVIGSSSFVASDGTHLLPVEFSASPPPASKGMIIIPNSCELRYNKEYFSLFIFGDVSMLDSYECYVHGDPKPLNDDHQISKLRSSFWDADVDIMSYVCSDAVHPPVLSSTLLSIFGWTKVLGGLNTPTSIADSSTLDIPVMVEEDSTNSYPCAQPNIPCAQGAFLLSDSHFPPDNFDDPIVLETQVESNIDILNPEDCFVAETQLPEPVESHELVDSSSTISQSQPSVRGRSSFTHMRSNSLPVSIAVESFVRPQPEFVGYDSVFNIISNFYTTLQQKRSFKRKRNF